MAPHKKITVFSTELQKKLPKHKTSKSIAEKEKKNKKKKENENALYSSVKSDFDRMYEVNKPLYTFIMMCMYGFAKLGDKEGITFINKF